MTPTIAPRHRRRGLALAGDDGVVKYESAHLKDVDSEKVVRREHSVRRILLLHIGAR